MNEPALKDVWDTLDHAERMKARRAITMLRDHFADASIAFPKRWQRLERFYSVLTEILRRMDERDAQARAARCPTNRDTEVLRRMDERDAEREAAK